MSFASGNTNMNIDSVIGVSGGGRREWINTASAKQI